MRAALSLILVLAIVVGLTLTGCGRGSVSVTAAQTSFTVGGTMSGLDGTVTLQLNGSEILAVTSNGSFAFTTELADAASYTVTVMSQPTSQTLDVANTSGTIDGANVTSVALTLEDISWTHPASLTENISPAGQDTYYPKVAMDDDGNALLVWYQHDGSRTQVFKSEYRSGAWAHPSGLTDSISPDGTAAIFPDAAMDDDGNAIVVWGQNDGTRYQIFKSEYRSGAWTHPTGAPDNISLDCGHAHHPKVAMDDDGNAIVVWYQYSSNISRIFKSEYRSGSWTHPTSLSDGISQTATNAYHPQVAMDSNGNALIAWYQHDGGKYQIFMSEYRSGSWTHPAALSGSISPAGQDATRPQVAMDDNGNALIVWRQHDGSAYQIFKSEYRSGSWTHPSGLTDNISPDGTGAYLADVAMDGNGNAIIAWAQPDGSVYQIFKSEYRSGAWTHPSSLIDNISPDGGAAQAVQVSMSDYGNAVIAWYQDDGTLTSIFKSEYQDGGWTHPASLTDYVNVSGEYCYYPEVATDSNGNVTIVWIQSDGSTFQVFKSERRSS